MERDAIDLRYPMLDITDEQINAELDHERGMIETGKARAEQRIAKEKARGNASTTPGMKTLLQQLALPLAEAIDEEVERLSAGSVRRKPPELRTLKLLPARDLAVVSLRSVLDGFGGWRSRDEATLQRLSFLIGNGVSSEVMARAFFKSDRPLFNRTEKRIAARSSNPGQRVKALLGAYNRVAEATDDPMSYEEKHRLGAFILTILESRGLVVSKNIMRGKGRLITIYDLTEEAWNVALKVDAAAIELRPYLLPTIIPPRPWEDGKDGGYWVPQRGKRLVKARVMTNGVKAILKEDAPRMFDPLNYLQNVPYRVNRKVLEVVEAMRAGGLHCASLPDALLEALPPKPHDIDTNEEARKAYRSAAREVHVRNASRKGRILATERTLSVARSVAEHERIYFPKVVDFRGRVYDMPQFLKPQGDDLSKGLLEFGNAKPLGDDGAEWLAIHIANTWGEDKVSFADRVRWVEANEDRILAAARSPLDERFWMDADAPFQFLAACFEWAGYKREGEGFMSRAMIALDGSCNGLQHLSAILRDPVGGRAVNLLPADKPQDIYTEVLNKVVADLKRRAELGEPTAQAWLPLMKRSVVKRPVMTLPYGATKQGYADQIMEDTLGPLEKAGQSPFGKEGYAACRYLAAIVWDATGETVVAARLVMDWLQEVAKVAAKEGKPLSWQTPSGFRVVQDYRAVKSRQVELRALGQRVFFSVAVGTEDKLDKEKMARSISPNFVHALDAAHMLRTVEQVIDTRGPGVHLSMVHDSYATHACDAGALALALRQAFIQMYEDGDWLALFRAEIVEQVGEAATCIPDPPKAGNLVLSDVINSRYFFA